MISKDVKKRIVRKKAEQYNKNYTEDVVKEMKIIKDSKDLIVNYMSLIKQQEEEYKRTINRLELKLDKKTTSINNVCKKLLADLDKEVEPVIKKEATEDLYYIDSIDSIGIVVYYDEDCIVYKIPVLINKKVEAITKTISSFKPTYTGSWTKAGVLPLSKICKVKGEGLKAMLFSIDTEVRKLAKGIIVEEYKDERKNSQSGTSKVVKKSK